MERIKWPDKYGVQYTFFFPNNDTTMVKVEIQQAYIEKGTCPIFSLNGT